MTIRHYVFAFVATFHKRPFFEISLLNNHSLVLLIFKTIKRSYEIFKQTFLSIIKYQTSVLDKNASTILKFFYKSRKLYINIVLLQKALMWQMVFACMAVNAFFSRYLSFELYLILYLAIKVHTAFFPCVCALMIMIYMRKSLWTNQMFTAM